MSKKLINIDIEDAKRKVAGLSGCRKCLFFNEFYDQLEVENRHADKKGGERVVAAMKEDGLNTDTSEYSIETLTRYHYLTPTPY